MTDALNARCQCGAVALGPEHSFLFDDRDLLHGRLDCEH